VQSAAGAWETAFAAEDWLPLVRMAVQSTTSSVGGGEPWSRQLTAVSVAARHVPWSSRQLAQVEPKT
jgi:hypothetical protein